MIIQTLGLCLLTATAMTPALAQDVQPAAKTVATQPSACTCSADKVCVQDISLTTKSSSSSSDKVSVQDMHRSSGTGGHGKAALSDLHRSSNSTGQPTTATCAAPAP